MTGFSAEALGFDIIRINLENLPGMIRQNIIATLEKEGQRLANIVMEDKLEGQVLNRRTGALQKSVHFGVDREGGLDVGYIGADTEYAARHEFGFIGTEQVSEHLRKRYSVSDQLREYFEKTSPKKQLSDAKRKSMMTCTIETVRAHQRSVNYPAHSYLRSTVAENADQIEAALDESVRDAISIMDKGL